MLTSDKLKRRLGITGSTKDALLADLLADAEAELLLYTGRAERPAGTDGIVNELAAIAYTRLGMEGESSHSEGGVSVSVSGIPAHLKAQMDALRVAKVG